MIKKIYTDGSIEYSFLAELKKRAGDANDIVTASVAEILKNVKNEGDAAVARYSKQFDGTDQIRILNQDDFKQAYLSIDDDFRNALEVCAKNITRFHTLQKERLPESIYNRDDPSRIVGLSHLSLERVAVYVPGGTASYPSSVLMNVIPAKIAGVDQIIIVTPPAKNGSVNLDILAAAYIAGAHRAILVGGAHGLAAVGYGTETIARVDKIVGPGNIYVATAKRLLYGTCDIDMIAGPSEITIIADESDEPRLVAADMISQAEHDKLASAILLTNSKQLAENTATELMLQTKALPRRDIIFESLNNNSAIIVTSDLQEAVKLANYIAPEHLEILTNKPIELMSKIRNAGSMFIGKYSPEPLGDYYAGVNHVLPTNGTARFFSPLSVTSFMKTIQFVQYTSHALKDAAGTIMLVANREGFMGHANSIKVRLDMPSKEVSI
ncbi:MAG: histidinol dehydrogenase [Christensenellaceae bacterium]|jgi:histidinol dehydrogenase|nr:histidinol dehydrogenase [Christensenellaceae bacterium]